MEKRQGHASASPFLLALAGLVCFVAACRTTYVSRQQLEHRFDLSYESPNLATVRHLQQNQNVYDPALYAEPPFHFTLYTPLWHSIVASIPLDSANPFRAGRILCALFMVLATLNVLLIRRNSSSATTALFLIGAYFLVGDVCKSTILFKNDSLALFLASLAIVVATRFANSKTSLAAAAALCCLAFACKQSFICAPLAIAGGLLAQRQRNLLMFLSVYVVLMVGLLAGGRILWGPGFLFCILQAPNNPMAWSQFLTEWRHALSQPMIIVIAVIGLTCALFSMLRREKRGLLASCPFLYFLFTWLQVTIAIAKLGSGSNYFFEPLLASAIWIVTFTDQVQWEQQVARLGRWKGLLSLAVVSLLGYLMLFEHPSSHTFVVTGTKDAVATMFQQIRQESDELRLEPSRVLNLFHCGINEAFDGKSGPSDPYLYELLWQAGKLSTEPLLQAIESHRFQAIVDINSLDLDTHFNGELFEPIRRQIGKSYRLAKTGHTLNYYVPRTEDADLPHE